MLVIPPCECEDVLDKIADKHGKSQSNLHKLSIVHIHTSCCDGMLCKMGNRSRTHYIRLLAITIWKCTTQFHTKWTFSLRCHY